METVIFNSSSSWRTTLLNTITIGKELLYSTELAYSMLLMNVVGELHLQQCIQYGLRFHRSPSTYRPTDSAVAVQCLPRSVHNVHHHCRQGSTQQLHDDLSTGTPSERLRRRRELQFRQDHLSAQLQVSQSTSICPGVSIKMQSSSKRHTMEYKNQQEGLSKSPPRPSHQHQTRQLQLASIIKDYYLSIYSLVY